MSREKSREQILTLTVLAILMALKIEKCIRKLELKFERRRLSTTMPTATTGELQKRRQGSKKGTWRQRRRRWSRGRRGEEKSTSLPVRTNKEATGCHGRMPAVLPAPPARPARPAQPDSCESGQIRGLLNENLAAKKETESLCRTTESRRRRRWMKKNHNDF